MLINKENNTLHHKTIKDLPRLLPQKSVLIVNDTKVIKARLRGLRPSGGRVEVLIVSIAPVGEEKTRIEALLRSNRPIRPGHTISLNNLMAEVHSRGERGEAELTTNTSVENLKTHIDNYGEVPLPPYIRREAAPEDVERYQTVYAEHDGSVAAPTAGLHFTPALLNEIRQAGITIATVTLHVGPGTFRPVTAENIDDHEMDAEVFRLSKETISIIQTAKAEGRPIIAVGTTVTRALEGAFQAQGKLVAGEGKTNLFIKPGFTFRVIDGLMTNFHLPKSTLLCLVSALAGRERIMSAYNEAIEQKYRFYSYGDAMLILPDSSR